MCVYVYISTRVYIYTYICIYICIHIYITYLVYFANHFWNNPVKTAPKHASHQHSCYKTVERDNSELCGMIV